MNFRGASSCPFIWAVGPDQARSLPRGRGSGRPAAPGIHWPMTKRAGWQSMNRNNITQTCKKHSDKFCRTV